jgi:multiple sugar transport system ATP-binding protein
MRCRGVPREQQIAAVGNVAELLQIGLLLDRKPSQLSGGQRQRVAIGRALVRDPALFLFDEPLSNLDAKLRVQMRMELKALHRKIGKTTVYVTHDQIEAMTLATRVAVMHQGEIQQFDRPDVVYNHPANLFVARFMGSPPMNTAPARIERDGEGLAAVIGWDRPEAIKLALPIDNCPAERCIDREIVIGIRPECITEARGGSFPVVRARVTMTETTGPETIAMLELGGASMLGKLSPDSRLALGETGEFEIDTRKVSLFDAATEKLIAPQSN